MQVGAIIDEIEKMEHVLERANENIDETRMYHVSSYDMDIIRSLFDKYKNILRSMEVKEE